MSAIFAACMNTRQEKRRVKEGGKERGGEERKRMKLAGTPCFFKYRNLKQTELRDC